MKLLNAGFELPKNVSDMTGYEHLYMMCKHVRNESGSWKGFLDPITPRVSYIMEALSLQGQQFQFVPLIARHSISDKSGSAHIGQDDNKLANVMVSFKGTNPKLPAVMFTAHHDISNPRSENCQDNTASVCNLLHLCAELKGLEKRQELKQNVIVGFTDAEECGGHGMNKVVSQIKDDVYGEVEAIFCLELTANGTEMWVTGMREDSHVSRRIDRSTEKKVSRVSTPYNESANARRAGLPAVCIGTLKPSEMAKVNGVGFGCSTWSLCHSMRDTFEHSANKEEMNNFVDAMIKMVDTGEAPKEKVVTSDNQLSLLDAIKEEEDRERKEKWKNNYSATPAKNNADSQDVKEAYDWMAMFDWGPGENFMS